MNNYGASTILDLDTIPESPVKEEGHGGAAAGGGGGGGGTAATDACCSGHGDKNGHSHQKKISLDVMEEGKEAEYLFEAVKAG